MGLFSRKNQVSNLKRTGKRLLLVTGCMLSLFMLAPVANSSGLGSMIAYASELPYSSRWETQSDGSWKYKLDTGGYATSAWVHDEVDGNWYLLSESGIMRSGIFESYGKYYLLSEVHDGHYGHLVKNGEVYNGITITADTNADYEGALSQESLNSLQSSGYNLGSAPSVTGTQHVSNGKVESGGSGGGATENNTNADIDYSLGGIFEDTKEPGTGTGSNGSGALNIGGQ